MSVVTNVLAEVAPAQTQFGLKPTPPAYAKGVSRNASGISRLQMQRLFSSG